MGNTLFKSLFAHFEIKLVILLICKLVKKDRKKEVRS